MSVAVKNEGGALDDGSGGTGEEKPNKEKSDTVTREAYENVLTEKKKLKERLDALDADSKKRQEDELKAKEEYKKLYESAKAEADEAKKQKSELETGLNEGKKLQAFLGKLPGRVAKEYWGLIDLERVGMDPETREIDEGSLAKAVKEFESKHSRLIDKPNGAKLPDDAPKGATGKLTYDEWKKLPLDEQKKRMKEVDKTTL